MQRMQPKEKIVLVTWNLKPAKRILSKQWTKRKYV